MLRDLARAKAALFEKNLTLCMVKKGKVIFETDAHGVSGFLEAIEKRGRNLVGASVADKTVGRAVALLAVYARVKAVYAQILSKPAKSVLKKAGIQHGWTDLVDNILGPGGKGTCPFEQLAAEISDPTAANVWVRNLQGWKSD